MSATGEQPIASPQDAADHIAREARQWLLALGLRGALGWAPIEAGKPESLAHAMRSATADSGGPSAWHIAQTPLGQPLLVDVHGHPLPGWNLSFAHDGGLRLCAAAHGSTLMGMGVDLVHLPRLRRSWKDARYLLRLAERILPKEALAFNRAEWDGTDLRMLRETIAAHFALMEAGAKALGAGLRLGAGLGQAFGLPPRSVGAARVSPQVRMFAEGEASARLTALGGERLAGQWWLRAELLVGLAVALRAESGDGPADRA